MSKNGKLHAVPGRAVRRLAPVPRAAPTPAGPPPKPMTVIEWRASRRDTRTLPSGLQVELQKVTLLSLIAAGQIPQTLIAMVEDLSKRGIGRAGVAEFQKFAPAVNAVCLAAVRRPIIVPVGAELPDDDEHILVTDLDFEDRLMIFDWCNAKAVSLQPFPGEPTPPGVADVHPSDDVGRAPEQSF
jgi:hypothetical protein